MSNSIDATSVEYADTQAVLAFRGVDSASFLQGQLSFDVEKLAPGASALAGLHNPQGRVIALLAVTRTTAEEFFAVVPRDLAQAVVQRLKKFVFRSKASVEDVSETLRVYGAFADARQDIVSIAWGGRRLLLVPPDHEIAGSPGATLDAWNREDVKQGLPQVYAATSESFVAQMLNLDVLGAISFDKGCYTGQEVIARAHYRGRVKRRMQRWLNTGGTLLAAGDPARGPDGRALTVVRAGPRDAEGQEVLAVGTFGSNDAGAPSPVPGDAQTVIVSGPLPLPYGLPE